MLSFSGVTFSVLFRLRLFDFIEAGTLCPIVFRYLYACGPTAIHSYITTVWDPFCFTSPYVRIQLIKINHNLYTEMKEKELT